MRVAAFGAILLYCLSVCANAQDSHFEVASIKPVASQTNAPPSLRGGPGTPDPGRIAFTNVTLRHVLERAYGVLDDQVSAPPWLGAQRWDILLTLPAETTKEQFSVMLQNLLAERFQLSFHRDKKEFAVYELVQARGGSKLRPGASPGEAKPVKDIQGGMVDRKGFPVPRLTGSSSAV